MTKSENSRRSEGAYKASVPKKKTSRKGRPSPHAACSAKRTLLKARFRSLESRMDFIERKLAELRVIAVTADSADEEHHENV